jgi:hypothetical protein
MRAVSWAGRGAGPRVGVEVDMKRGGVAGGYVLSPASRAAALPERGSERCVQARGTLEAAGARFFLARGAAETRASGARI